MNTYSDILRNFSINALPELDVVTLGALELFSATTVPKFDYKTFSRPLVVGSGNAAVVGKILFDNVDAVFADESSYEQKLLAIESIDGAVIISASGGKHAIPIAQELKRRGVCAILLTNNSHAPAKEVVGEGSTFVFPKNREPYTYNTSTYLGMLLSKTAEDASALLGFIEDDVVPAIPQNLGKYGAFYLIVPERFGVMCEMFQTKFNELFGPKLMARVFTTEQTKHAKTVIQREDELFISFGTENSVFGLPQNRLSLPLQGGADYGAMLCVGYVTIGHIQRQFPPFYKERIAEYCKETSAMFGNTILPIVE